jgi:hypothetical protein
VRFDHGARFGRGFAGKIGFHFFKLKMGNVREGASDGGAVGGDSQFGTDIRIQGRAAIRTFRQVRTRDKQITRRESALAVDFELAGSEVRRHLLKLGEILPSH